MGHGSRVFVVDYSRNVDGSPHVGQPEMQISPEDVAGWTAEAGFDVPEEWDLFGDRFVVEYTKRD